MNRNFHSHLDFDCIVKLGLLEVASLSDININFHEKEGMVYVINISKYDA